MVLHGSTWLFLTLGAATQSPGSARLSLALLDSWIGTVLFFFLLLWLVYRRGLRLLLLLADPVHSHGSFFTITPVHSHGVFFHSLTDTRYIRVGLLPLSDPRYSRILLLPTLVATVLVFTRRSNQRSCLSIQSTLASRIRISSILSTHVPSIVSIGIGMPIHSLSPC